MMRAQRRDALTRPAIAVACNQSVPVQDAGDKIVVGRSAPSITAAITSAEVLLRCPRRRREILMQRNVQCGDFPHVLYRFAIFGQGKKWQPFRESRRQELIIDHSVAPHFWRLSGTLTAPYKRVYSCIGCCSEGTATA
jgi:hypothetical protein